jgi:hypothetical protein
VHEVHRVVYVQVRRNGAKRAHCLQTPFSAVGSVFVPTWYLNLCVSCESVELAKIHSTERVCYVDSFIFYSTLMFIICVNNPNIDYNQFNHSTDWILYYWFLYCWS